MIPAPPLTDDGKLAQDYWQVRVNIVGGISGLCCVCRQDGATHWDNDGQFVALHERCVLHLIQEWQTMIENGEAKLAAPTERLLGAYARRAAERSGQVGPELVAAESSVSMSLGSPFFQPGMPKGTPWVAVAEMADGRPIMISPAGASEAHARKVNRHWQAAASRGFVLTFSGRGLPNGGYVCDPTGARLDAWTRVE